MFYSLFQAFAACVGCLLPHLMVKPMKAPCLGPLGNAKKLVASCGPKTSPTQATNPDLQRHQRLRYRLPTMAPDLQASLAPLPANELKVLMKASTFLSLGIQKMMLKKCLYTHTHPPATRNPAASTTPIASLSGNTLLFNRCETTPKE